MIRKSKVIRLKKSDYPAGFTVHKRTPADYVLRTNTDGTSFYQTALPEVFYEIQIDGQPKQMSQMECFRQGFKYNKPLHIHTGTDGNEYVCYPQPLDTLQKVDDIIHKWTVVTMFTIVTHCEINHLENAIALGLQKALVQIGDRGFSVSAFDCAVEYASMALQEYHDIVVLP